MNKLEDELTRYLRATVLILNPNEEFDLLTWWRGNSQEYPVLSRIAIDIFSIPAMSVEPERVFSGYDWKIQALMGSCKLTLTDCRNRLRTEIVEAVECLRDWLGAGFVDGIICTADE
jgi:hypothetical protein